MATPELDHDLFYPLQAALKFNRVDSELVELTDLPHATELILGGQLPNKAGIVRLPSGIGAFDLVDLVYITDREVVVRPTEKDRVNSDDCRFQQGGDLIFSLPGLIRPYGRVLTPEQADWNRRHSKVSSTYAHRRNATGLPVDRYPFGSMPIYRSIRVEDDGTTIARS